MTTSVYKLTCLPTNDFYIGCSTQVDIRNKQHESMIKNISHQNSNVQLLSTIYPVENWELVELCSYADERTAFEREAIEIYNQSNGRILNIVGVCPKYSREYIDVEYKGQTLYLPTDKYKRESEKDKIINNMKNKFGLDYYHKYLKGILHTYNIFDMYYYGSINNA